MVLTNIEMETYIQSLEPFLDRKDIIGYAAARNTRRFKEASAEYIDIRTELINKYGTEELDSKGNPTGRNMIRFDSPSFPQFKKEIEDIAAIEHKVQVFKIPFESVIGELTGSEILGIDWMLEDSDSPSDE